MSMGDEKRNLHDGKRILVSFGRSDPLGLTEATYKLLGDGPDYIWGPSFNRDRPKWASYPGRLQEIWECGSLYDLMEEADVVYCGHGATLLEATAAGCEVMVLTRVEPIEFMPAWTGLHLDHSGLPVKWWEPGVMAGMAREIHDRRGK